MKKTIEKTMNELRTDHRNMAMLLDLLDAESLRLVEDGEPDYQLVNDIMTYMTEYPDAIHHPKEDLIYGHINAEHGGIDKSLRHIEDDHKALGEASREILRDVDAINDDSVVDRESLAAALRKYSLDLRKHMFWEEKDLFELADSMQDDEAWAELLKSHNIGRDPLFGSSVERRFQKLFNSIQRRMVWDSQQYFV